MKRLPSEKELTQTDDEVSLIIIQGFALSQKVLLFPSQEYDRSESIDKQP
jgi:hypothetical protein